jgi:hypothetical protein
MADSTDIDARGYWLVSPEDARRLDYSTSQASIH